MPRLTQGYAEARRRHPRLMAASRLLGVLSVVPGLLLAFLLNSGPGQTLLFIGLSFIACLAAFLMWLSMLGQRAQRPRGDDE